MCASYDGDGQGSAGGWGNGGSRGGGQNLRGESYGKRKYGGGGGRGRGGGGGRGRGGSREFHDVGANPDRPPPGLKGKEIGLWYARRQRNMDPENKKMSKDKKELKLEEKDRISVFLTGTQKETLRSALDSVRREQAESGSPSDAARSITSIRINDDDDHRWFFPRRPLERDQNMDEKLQKDHHRMTESPGYQRTLPFRRKLPAFEKRAQVMKLIQSKVGNVSVISGSTGSGKTTQIPQFILDEALEKGDGSVTKIVCTQPRRISAISVAERVASERGESLPSSARNKTSTDGSVGFQIRLSSVIPRSAGSILYCTTGVVLKWLESDPQLLSVSHLILDEVHERDLQTDFLIICLKDLMQKRKDLKLILMSATLDAEMFSRYFSNAPSMDIPGRLFPVEEWLLEDVIEKLAYQPKPSGGGGFGSRGGGGRNRGGSQNQRFRALKEQHGGGAEGRNKANNQIAEEQRAKDEYWENKWERTTSDGPGNGSLSRRTIDAMKEMTDEIDYELIHRIVAHVIKEEAARGGGGGDRGAILIFVPGWAEISKCKSALESSRICRPDSLHIIPLHSLMPTSLQREIFSPPPPGKTKVVISTSIAETSVTIEDVVVVIDSGLIKTTSYDPMASVSILAPEFASLANGRQRAGRAGRVRPGICFHLYSSFAQSRMSEYLKPEMLRTPLEGISLQIKLLNRGSILSFLAKALNPPSDAVVARAVANLQQMQALDDDEDLTTLGLHLAKMNVDPHVGKMMLYGAIFGCLDPILTIAASLGYRDPFVMPLGKEKESDTARVKLSAGTLSDHLMLHNAFTQWDTIEHSGAKNDFAWRHFLAPSILIMLKDMKRDLAANLRGLGFVSSGNPKDPMFNVNSDNAQLVKAIICGGLYPQVARLKKTQVKNSHVSRKGFIWTNGVSKPVGLHAKSCLNGSNRYPSPWIVYHQLLVTSSAYIHDATLVDHFPLLFFGGRIEKSRQGGQEFVVVDDWIKFWCRHSVADDVIALRLQLHQILASKIRDPRKKDWTRGENAVLDAIVSLVASGNKGQAGSGGWMEDGRSSEAGSSGGSMGGHSNRELVGGGEEEEEEEKDDDEEDYDNY